MSVPVKRNPFEKRDTSKALKKAHESIQRNKDKRRNQISIEFAPAYEDLFRPFRYKVYYGGRGAAKSWEVARALILKAHTSKLRIGCLRELQSSIKDSVHKLLSDQIEAMGLSAWFHVTQKTIQSKVTGSEFLFKGLRHNATEIKSMEAVDIAWVEEAQLVSKDSWALLIPTIRKEGSEIWVTFNPIQETDETFVRFVKNPPPNSIVKKVNWDANPWFPSTLNAEREHMLRTAPEDYEHVWGGECKTISDACIFKGRYVIEAFEAPELTEFLFGEDFGFSGDPNAIIRMYITGKVPNEELWIDHEAFGYHVEIDELPQLMDSVPEVRKWPIKADNARPETISYLRRQGYRITAAEKWSGSVEDGIAHLKAFKKIHIHDRCKHMQQEARLYSWKVDKTTEEVLPIIVDANNHGWDAVRYGLSKYIQKRGANKVWEKL